MDFGTLALRLGRRWWVVVAALALLAVLGAVTATSGKPAEHRTTIQFVLRPASSVAAGDLPGTLDALKSDGTLVQTVVGVLGSPAMLRQAAHEAHVRIDRSYTVDSSVKPGSTLIESTVAGGDRARVDRLAAGYARATTNYIALSYPAYTLAQLNTEPASDSSGASAAQIVVLALLVGTALGLALVFLEARLEPQLRPIYKEIAAWRAARSHEGRSWWRRPSTNGSNGSQADRAPSARHKDES
jgi:uncharacterized protein involved in exopolysaccharide biosynthesis